MILNQAIRVMMRHALKYKRSKVVISCEPDLEVISCK